MIKRVRLENYLRELYKYKEFEDYCYNGLQIEGRNEVNKIALGVSLNTNLIDRAIEVNANAIIVHHGFFGKSFTAIQKRKKTLIEKLIKNDISLFGIHLPMDAQKEIGHNSLLFNAIRAKIDIDYEMGFIGKNINKLSLDDIIDNFSDFLTSNAASRVCLNSPFNIHTESGFTFLNNGPDVPNRIGIISGGASNYYERAINLGVDTFICGEIKEEIPSLSFDTKTNFICLGHYNSEKPGILKLTEILGNEFEVSTEFIDVPNPI